MMVAKLTASRYRFLYEHCIGEKTYHLLALKLHRGRSLELAAIAMGDGRRATGDGQSRENKLASSQYVWWKTLIAMHDRYAKHYGVDIYVRAFNHLGIQCLASTDSLFVHA